MKPFGALLPFEAAQRTIESNIEPISRVEAISIDDCLGRVLAEDVIASRSTPPFDRAAMDGYALKAEDTRSASGQSPSVLKIVDVLYAESASERILAAGECMQVATGTRMPRGADAVIMVENTAKENNRIKVLKPVQAEENISWEGEDIRKGELVLREGLVLDPGKIGVLASQGESRARVYEKPRVAVIPTGSEITEVGQKLKPGRIYDINSHTISAVVRDNGGIPLNFGIIGDDPVEIKATIEKALAADFVVISGGSSVGEKDLLPGILEEWGQVLFHGIKIKPGKPTLFALVRGKPVMGMPGYPTSCLINGYLMLAPALRRMGHLPPQRIFTVSARLSESVSGKVNRRQFLPVKIEADSAIPIFKKSGAITATAEADGYIIIAENSPPPQKGAPVTVTLF